MSKTPDAAEGSVSSKSNIGVATASTTPVNENSTGTTGTETGTHDPESI